LGQLTGAAAAALGLCQFVVNELGQAVVIHRAGQVFSATQTDNLLAQLEIMNNLAPGALSLEDAKISSVLGKRPDSS